MCANSLRLLFSSTLVSLSKIKIILYFYVYVFLVVHQDTAVVYNTKSSFGNIYLTQYSPVAQFSISEYFCLGREVDDPHGIVRSRICRILSERYTSGSLKVRLSVFTDVAWNRFEIDHLQIIAGAASKLRTFSLTKQSFVNEKKTIYKIY